MTDLPYPLGRKPSPPDERDFKLSAYLPATIDEAAAATDWTNNEPVLDQMQTNHCVGGAGAQWGNTLPIDDKYANADLHLIYYEACAAGGYPNTENGATVRDLAKALKTRGRLNTYAFAASVDEAIAWIQAKGPIVFGTVWKTGMFKPDASGLIHPKGRVAGGHAYIGVGYDPATTRIKFMNDWGKDWGVNGRFYMLKADFVKVFAKQGEALAGVELP